MSVLTIRKLDPAGHVVAAYPGAVVARPPGAIVLEAFFQHAAVDLGCARLERGDRFVEYFYADRWYNVFKVYAGPTGVLRGWYCNLSRPAVITATEVSAVDLALDVWVTPAGQPHLLDEEAFNALPLAPADRAAVQAALAELLNLVTQRASPFAP